MPDARPKPMLILDASSFRHALAAARGGLSLLDLPRKAHDELGLRGLVLPTDFLAGADIRRIETLRERADKALCPCLYLVETEVHYLGSAKPDDAAASADRLDRVLQAAQRLGCSAAGVRIGGPDSEESLALAAERLKPLAHRAERLDLSLLLCPTKGLTTAPERISDLLKKIGGFRIGLLPDFKAAGATDDPASYLRRLAPYAPVVLATAGDFDDSGRHVGYSLEECAAALLAVGYEGAVAIGAEGKTSVEQTIQRMRRILEPLLLGEIPDEVGGGELDDLELGLEEAEEDEP